LRLGLGLASVVVLAVLWMPSHPGDRSSRDQGVRGCAAFAGVLERMGMEVQSLRVGLRPIAQRPVGSVLVLPVAQGALGSPALASYEVQRVIEFVTSGSTLIIVTDRDHSLLSAFGISYLWDELDAGPRGAVRRYRGTAVLPAAHALDGPLSLHGRGGLDPGASGAEPLFAVAGTPVVVRKQIGEGQVVVVSDPFTISNEGLGAGANLDFYVGLIGDSLQPSGVVMFDDLHAGAGTERGIVAYARNAGFLPALLLIALLAVLYLWRAGSRLGVVLPAVDRRDSRPSSEMVLAVGSLYDRAGLVHHALEVGERRLRNRVVARARLAWGGEAIELWVEQELGSQALEELRWLQRRFSELRGQARPAMEDVLKWARRSQDFQGHWPITDRSSTNPIAAEAHASSRLQRD